MTRYSTLLAFIITAALATPPVARACGYSPWSEFSAESMSAANANLLLAPQLPILSPSWNSEYWVAAWARLSGKQFSDAEAASLGEDWLSRDGRMSAALDEWMQARSDAGHAGPRPRTGRTLADYRHLRVCAPDAFRSAAATLRSRVSTSSDDTIQRWIEAQTAVFGACSDAAAPAPAAPPDFASVSEKDDYAYQYASWLAYAQTTADPHTTQINAAHRRPLPADAFAAIALSTSPWSELSAYRAEYLRHASGAVDLAAISRLRQTARDPKVVRALRQLDDRASLFLMPPDQVVDTLVARVLHEDLAGDLGRTLEDIVTFSKRDDHRCDSVVGILASRNGIVNCEAVDSFSALERGDSLGFLLSIRHGRVSQTTVRRMGETPEMRINALFHQGGLVLARAPSRARSRAIELVRLARHSTAATRNAAAALALASSPGANGLRYVARNVTRTANRGDSGTTIHGDGWRYLATRPIRSWRALGRRHPELRPQVEQAAFIRSLIEDANGLSARTLRLGRRIADHHDGPRDNGLSTRLRDALLLPPEAQHGAFLLALATLDPSSFSISEAFESHWGSVQSNGCSFGECQDSHPNQTAASTIVGTGRWTQRARFLRFGTHVLEFAQAHEHDDSVPELLSRFVRLTRRASLHARPTVDIGQISRRAFTTLHERYPDDRWTAETRYWYR